MESIKIDKNIPLPENKRNSRAAKYPLNQMKIGDSFEVLDSQVTRSGIRSTIWFAAKNTTLKFATRKTENGTRVWRTE